MGATGYILRWSYYFFCPVEGWGKIRSQRERLPVFRRAMVFFFIILCPYMGCLFLIYDGRVEVGRDILLLWVIAQAVCCVPFSRWLVKAIVGKDLREIRKFVVALQEGDGPAPLFTDLPNQSEDEDDLVQLKRAANELSRVVSGYRIRAGECLLEARQGMSRYRQMANVDQLTGVYNRRAFDEELSARIKSVCEEDGVFYLLFLDLDDFKQVNDNHGHQAGDEILALMGTILREQTRGHDDFPFRYGGDEFGLILGEDSSKAAQKIARRIRNCFVENDYGSDVSIGGVRFTRQFMDEQGDARRVLCQRVDEALYMAKQSKGMRTTEEPGCVFFDS